MQFVPDNTLDKIFGGEVADEIRSAVHPGGDCRSCGRQFTPDANIRFDLDDSLSSMVMVWPRHATCRPTTSDIGIAIMTPTTYLVSAVGIQASRPASGRLGKLLGKTTTVMFPVLVLNPAIDGFGVRLRDDGSAIGLLEEHRERGLHRPGTTPMDSHVDPAQAGIKVSWSSTVHGYKIKDLTGAEYVMADLDQTVIPESVNRAGGFILAVTYRYPTIGFESGSLPVEVLLTDPDGSAHLWIPKERIEHTD